MLLLSLFSLSWLLLSFWLFVGIAVIVIVGSVVFVIVVTVIVGIVLLFLSS